MYPTFHGGQHQQQHMSFQEDVNLISQSAGMPLKQLASDRLKKMATEKHSSPKSSKYELPEAANDG